MSVAIKLASLVVHRVRKLRVSIEAPGRLSTLKKARRLQCQGQVLVGALLATAALQAAAQGWTITPDTELVEYTEKKEAAKALARDVRKEVEAALPLLRAYWQNGLSPAVPAQGKKFAALVRRADELSEPFGPFASCRGAAIFAQQLWQSHLGSQLKADVLYSAWQAYSEGLRDCQLSIDIPPAETITVVGPAERGDELPASCLDAGKNTWTCPASLRSAIEAANQKR
ncbi:MULTISPECIES: hypothetical protein [Achromobacter]|uniref:Uncharacterized protein n=1 Tax=Achromobacter denitrificans TaxID=32002 RepID=A0A6N0JG22_ACHDE|nr:MULTISPECIES: hypothetical protein [Achromobacter]QKQ45696.1 hypothetical protein FOC81_02835 [Achromobacter denitrificans]CAB3886372.1 hypothetical protein LMG1860_04605 [Achromobacter denitrificans]